MRKSFAEKCLQEFAEKALATNLPVLHSSSVALFAPSPFLLSVSVPAPVAPTPEPLSAVQLWLSVAVLPAPSAGRGLPIRPSVVQGSIRGWL